MSESTLLSTSAFRVLGLIIGILIISGCGGYRTRGQAEKIFINGQVITMDDRLPQVEALAVAKGKIISIGTATEIKNSHPEAEVVDLRGKTVMPGIIESHGHLLSLGQSFLQLNLVGVQTPQDI